MGLGSDASKWKCVGSGGYSDVYIASYEKKQVAVKIIREGNDVRKNSSFVKEIEVLRSFYFA